MIKTDRELGVTPPLWCCFHSKALVVNFWVSFVINEIRHRCEFVPGQRRPSCFVILSLCARSVTSTLILLSHKLYLNSVSSLNPLSHSFLFSCTPFQTTLLSFISCLFSMHPLHPSSPISFFHFYTFISLPLRFLPPFPSPVPPFFFPLFILFSSNFLPLSLHPGTVYNLPLFFSPFLPLPSFLSCSLSLSLSLARPA